MVLKSNFGAFFSRHVFPTWYNAKSLEINVVISGNVLLFKDIKISLGLLITAPARNARPISGKSLPRGVNNCK